MTVRHQYTAEEVLIQLQEISSDFSGDNIYDQDGSDSNDIFSADMSDDNSHISSNDDTLSLEAAHSKFGASFEMEESTLS